MFPQLAVAIFLVKDRGFSLSIWIIPFIGSDWSGAICPKTYLWFMSLSITCELKIYSAVLTSTLL